MLFVFEAVLVSSQEVEPINTDRPDQSDGTYILTKNNFQVENGAFWDKESVLNNLMVRYGVTKSTELRILVDAGKVTDNRGVLPIGFSFKQRIIHQNKFIPAITLVGYYRNEQLASRIFSSSNYNYFLNIAFQNDLSDKWSVGYNAGTTEIGNNLIYTTSFVFSPKEQIMIFWEYFARFERGFNPQHNTDAGVMYIINKKFQLDVAFATSFFRDEVYQFATAGFSYRFK